MVYYLDGISLPGGTYIRWGKKTCPTEVGTEIIYKGFTGASRWNESGGGANYLCMPESPEYNSDLNYREGIDGSSTIYGVEYEVPVQGTHDDNAPCALCLTPNRPTVIMIPARFTCPQSWTIEYYGYLMSQSKAHSRTMFVCVDHNIDNFAEYKGENSLANFYNVEASCHGLPCGPYNYNDNKELNCVVCTK